MRKLHATVALALAALFALTLSAQPRVSKSDNPKVVVGTFDSRAVLMAYVRSADFQEYLAAQKQDVGRAIDRAKAAGDDATLAALNALGPDMQKRIYDQGFGTAPVDDLIARIHDKLPAIAQEAGVDVIVSRWVLSWQDPQAKFVDVTDLIAAEYHPDEATVKGIHELVKTEPVPLHELKVGDE